MPVLSEMTEAEIAAALTVLHARDVASYNERVALEDELQRRATSARGEAVLEALRHQRFGVSFDFRPAVFCRIPDSDWIEDDYDTQEAVTRVEKALSSRDIFQAFVVGTHKFLVRYEGDRFYVWPYDRKDKDAWATLISFVEERLPGNFDTKYDLECLDVVLPTIRELAGRPKPEPA